jgi:hypothetical protein
VRFLGAPASSATTARTRHRSPCASTQALTTSALLPEPHAEASGDRIRGGEIQLGHFDLLAGLRPAVAPPVFLRRGAVEVRGDALKGVCDAGELAASSAARTRSAIVVFRAAAARCHRSRSASVHRICTTLARISPITGGRDIG